MQCYPPHSHGSLQENEQEWAITMGQTQGIFKFTKRNRELGKESMMCGRAVAMLNPLYPLNIGLPPLSTTAHVMFTWLDKPPIPCGASNLIEERNAIAPTPSFRHKHAQYVGYH